MMRMKALGCVAALLLALNATLAHAVTVDFVPTTPGTTTFNGNLGAYYNTNPGLLFTVGDPGSSVTIDQIGVNVGQTLRPTDTLRMGLHRYTTGGITHTLTVQYLTLVQGDIGWKTFDLGGLVLPHSLIGTERTNYLVEFSVASQGHTQGLQFYQASSQNPTPWDQDGFKFIYGTQGLSLSRVVPGVRFDLVMDTTGGQVPLPASAVFLMAGLGALATFRREWAPTRS